MADILLDTDPETARVHLELIRRSSAARRLHLALSLSATTIGLARTTLAANLSEASPTEVALGLVARLYGAELAEEVRADLAARRT